MKYQQNTWPGTMNLVDKGKILPFGAQVKYNFGTLDLAHKPRPVFVALAERERDVVDVKLIFRQKYGLIKRGQGAPSKARKNSPPKVTLKN